VLTKYLAGRLQDFRTAEFSNDLLFGAQTYTDEFSLLNWVVASRLPKDPPAFMGGITPG
jgi:hypothetical protein